MDSAELIKKLQAKFNSIQSSDDILNYGLYERIADYIRYIEEEPTLANLIKTLRTDSFVHQSFKKLMRLKEVIDSPDNVDNNWFIKKFGDTHAAIDFMFFYQPIKNLKNTLRGRAREKAEQGFMESNYKGELANIHYALVELLENISEDKIEPQKVQKIINKPNGIAFKLENGNGILIYKNKPYTVGKTTSRKYKLLKVLSDPELGIARDVDNVFSAIRIPKDSTDKSLINPHTRDNKVKNIIKDALGDLNKAMASGDADFRFKLTTGNPPKNISLNIENFDL